MRDGADASNAFILIENSPGPVPLKADEEPSAEMTPAELHEYISEKLTRTEIATLWWRMFSENMENEGPTGVRANALLTCLSA